MGRTGRALNFALLSAGLFALSCAAGCQPTTSSTNNTGGTGDGGSGATTNTGAAGGSGGAGATGGGGAGATGGGGTGGSTTSTGIPGCPDDIIDATVYDITDSKSPNAIGMNITVKLEKVIAMSPKRLISHSSSGSCLWGIFVSASQTNDPTPTQLTTTAPYSGVIALSYGPKAAADQPCLNRAEALAAGVAENELDAFPDDVKVGDELTVVGKTSKFIQSGCGQQPADSDIAQTQLFGVCHVAKTGTAAVPAPHVLTPEEITALSMQKTTDGADVLETHNKWGSVFLRAENVPVDPWPGQNGNPDTIVGPYGKVRLAPGPLEIPDGLYYVKGSAAVCESGPKFDSMYTTPFTFDYAQGFHYLSFCTWSLANTDKCADFAPQSPDCVQSNITACNPN